jgi:SWIM zinc finger
VSHPVVTLGAVAVIAADDVLALAPDEAAARAARSTASPSAWSAAGHDETGAWGIYVATAAEPYEVAADLRGPAFRCSCPSRKVPCKHALGLLLLVANGDVPMGRRLPFAQRWFTEQTARAERAAAKAAEREAKSAAPRRPVPSTGDSGGPPNRRALERAARVRAGLDELDRWLADRVRAGLAAPELAEPATWERVAARLVDAQCGGLANRVLRIAGRVGADDRWHEHVLAELAVLHALAVAGRRVGEMDEALADGVRSAVGYLADRDHILAGVPVSDTWHVAGVSDTQENRVVVRRTWLWGQAARRWALVLSFAAFGESLDDHLPPGTAMQADLHWYPARLPLRAVIGTIHADPVPDPAGPAPATISDALATAGQMVVAEPWLERAPLCVRASAAPLAGGRWALTDDGGSIALSSTIRSLPELVALTARGPVVIAGEWSASGFLPLTAWTEGRAVPL